MRSLSVLKSQQLVKLLGLPKSPAPGLIAAKARPNLAALLPLARRPAVASALANSAAVDGAASPTACPLRRLGLAGSWVLPPGRAVTLQSADDSALQVTQGRIWATLDGPHSGPANDLGDVVLQAGERLALRAGQRVVIESIWPGAGRVEGGVACFSLD